jgi:OmcA/MtrC family decaheme c-type cytochrome
MNRIALALSLVVVLAAGCGDGTGASSSGTGRGVPGSSFTLEVRGDVPWQSGGVTTTRPRNGTVVSSPAGIVCGEGGAACAADFPWGTAVTLTATGAAGYPFHAFAGSCSGTDDCVLPAARADQMVVVRFAATYISHPNFSTGVSHAGVAYTLDCASCHGRALQGQGLAPGCASCHPGTATRRAGLAASIERVSTTAPVTVQFTLRDGAGLLVDATGVATTNPAWSRASQPIPLTLSLAFFASGAGGVSGYRSGTGGNPGTVTALAGVGATVGGSTPAVYPTAANRLLYPDGFLTRSGVACTLAAPCTCSTATPCQPSGRMGFQGGRACTASEPCTCSSASPCSAGLADADGPAALTLDRTSGVYTFTFPATTVYPDPALMASLTNATVWLQAARQENLSDAFDAERFTAVNVDHPFATPGLGGTALARRITDDGKCAACHDGFRAEANATGTGWASFHGAARVSGPYCAVCHYEGRGTGGAADSAVFVHRIHASEQILRIVQAGTSTTGLRRNADGTRTACSASAPCACSGVAPCVPNAFHGIEATYPQTATNCRACHPDTAQGNQYRTRPTRRVCGSCHDAVDFAAGAGHSAQPDDSQCAGCHVPNSVDWNHEGAIPPDGASLLHVAGGNKRTNAGWLVPAGKLPPSAIRLTAVVREVVRTAAGNPAISFKLQGQIEGGPLTDVVFNASTARTEMIGTDLVGSAGVTFAWAVPQDGIAAPADFNATASSSLKLLWNGRASGAKAGTLTGPDGGGFYTATLTGTIVPAAAVMLTGGIGYQYDLPDNQPFTQTNLSWYPAAPAGNGAYPDAIVGGLIVPIQNVWKTATGHAARRPIVETARCNGCHAQLGVVPTFHVGQRNDAPTCAFCHNGNRSSAGASVNAPVMIHAIHGARTRTTPYWTGAFAGVEVPGTACTQCHLPGTYDLAAAASQAALPALLWTYTTATAVSSPLSAACTACHDGAATAAHVATMGGVLGGARGADLLQSREDCLACHGAGRVLDVSLVHRLR